MSEEEKLHNAQMEFHFQARQRFELEQVMDKAFELHHGQMERSVNPYFTTNLFSTVLEDLSKLDDLNEASPVPSWARAMFILEETFDEQNDAARAQLMALNDRSTRDHLESQLKQYEESVAELEGDFDYDRLRLPSMQRRAADVREDVEDISGVGDSLDALIANVLPGLDAEAEAEAQEYADELIDADDFEAELVDADADDDDDAAAIDF